MRRRLPPLNALHTFEAAGRHVSFTRASEELGVTPGAVSRQIKTLEEMLGVVLFDRTGSELRLTVGGRKYLEVLTSLFDQLDSATTQLRDDSREQHLHVYCPMTLTLRWLVPRLASYHSTYPQRSVRLTTTLPNVIQLSSGDIDVVVRQGNDSWPNAISHRLLDTQLLPVCSPKLLETMPLSKLADLRQHTLLHSLARPHDWMRWLSAVNAPTLDLPHNIRFESSSIAYQAAVEGIGCVIGQLALVFEDLIAGRLVAPFNFVLDDGAFEIVYHSSASNNTRLVEFRDWIMSEAARFRKSMAANPPKLGAVPH